MPLTGLTKAPWSKFSVRTYFGALIVGIFVPGLMLTGWLALSSAQAERELLQHSLRQKAQDLSRSIDSEVINKTSMLTALASSHYLQNGDVEEFYRQAKLVAQQLGVTIVLRDATQPFQIFNTAVPFGTTLLKDILPEIERAHRSAMKTDGPIVSDSFYGRYTHTLNNTVALPVKRRGRLAYYLAVAISNDTYVNLLRQGLPYDTWHATIVDKSQRVIARYPRADQFVGKTLSADAVPQEQTGEVERLDFEGVETCYFFYRSPSTGWMTFVGIPKSVMDAPSKIAVSSFSSAGALLLFIAIGFAHHVGGRLSVLAGELGIDRKPTREEFHALFESAPNGVLAINGEGIVTWVNVRTEMMFGHSRGALFGRSIESLMPRHNPDNQATSTEDFLPARGASAIRSELTLYGLRNGGEHFPVAVKLNPIHTPKGNLVMATVSDITDQVAISKERETLRRRLTQAQESERLKLAHELHDKTGQSLAAVMMELKMLAPLVGAKEQNHIHAITGQLEDMGRTLHQVAWELRPASIDALGLDVAIADYVSEWSLRHSIATDFQRGRGDFSEIPDETQTVIYRLVQEALTNIVKHAPEARNVSIVLDHSDGMLRLTIEDDGDGFEQPSNDEAAGIRLGSRLGHATMRERISLVSGNIEIDSAIGIGTTIFARIPMQRDILRS